MVVSVRIKRGTRAQLDAAAGVSGLSPGEPYLISDEGRLAVGTASGAYAAMARQDEVPATGDIDYGQITSSPSSSADYGSLT